MQRTWPVYLTREVPLCCAQHTGYSTDKTKMYSTTAGELAGEKGPSAKLSATVKADLRKSHFDVGMRDAMWKVSHPASCRSPASGTRVQNGLDLTGTVAP